MAHGEYQRCDAVTPGEARMFSDQSGNIVVRVLTSPYRIWRYDGSTWTEASLPTTIGSTPFPNPVTVDASGALWSAFFAGGSNKGVYYSTNNGATWNYAGLKGVLVSFLTAVGDTVYAVTAIDGIHAFTTSSSPTLVTEIPKRIPATFELLQNYPNPFNPSTMIAFDLPSAGHVRLRIFDLLGREVAVLLDEEVKAGRHQAYWNASKMSSGVYFYRIEAGQFAAVRKLILLK
jgi:hypothetical protein